MLRSTNAKKQMILFFGDALLIIASFFLTLHVRFLGFSNVSDSYTGAVIIIVFVYSISFYIFGICEFTHNFKSAYFLTRYITSIGLATLLIAGIFYSFPWWRAGRGLLLINMFFFAYFAYLWRIIFHRLFLAYWKPKRILIVGAGYAGKYIAEVLKNNPNYTICGFLDDDPEKQKNNICSCQVLGSYKIMSKVVEKEAIDAIVVAITHEKHPDLLNALLNIKLKRVEIYDMPTFYEEVTGKIPVSHLREGWVVYASFQGMKRNLYVPIKYYLDMLLSLVASIILLPLIVIVAILIKIDSPGKVFYKQKRVGLNNREYNIIKFRSMVSNAEANGAIWATNSDSRVTRMGRFMRKTRIDEIPQLWNVLAGEMSFVGPRPERPEFIDEFTLPFYALRHVVKPGITGWAQVNYKYTASQEGTLEKLTYDIFYIKNMSFMLDMQIILKTINVVLFREGAR